MIIFAFCEDITHAYLYLCKLRCAQGAQFVLTA